MQLKYLYCKSFLSFKELSYDFESVPVLIQGENLTEIESQESNGSGKSSLQSAIEYVIFKTTIKPLDSDLIFWGDKEAVVSLSIHCPIREQLLQITRTINLKGSSKLEILVNNQPQSFATVVDGNNWIIDWIGISKDDLRNYYIINKERYKSFFSSSNKEKIEMINRFSNAKLIDGVDKIVQEEVDLFEQDLKNYERNKTSIIATVQTLNSQVKFELNRDLETELKELVDSVNEEIEKVKWDMTDKSELIQDEQLVVPQKKREITEYKHTIEANSNLIKEVEVSLSKLQKIDFSDEYVTIDLEQSSINVKKNKFIEQKVTFNKNKREIESILNEIEKNITGSVICPKCSHKFLVGDPSVDIEEETKARIETNALLGSTEKSIQTIFDKLDELNQDERLITVKKTELQTKEDVLRNENRQLKDRIEQIKDEIYQTESYITGCQQAIDKSETKVKRLTGEYRELAATINSYLADIERAKVKEIDQKRIKELRIQMRAEGEKLRNINYSIKKKKVQIFETSQWIFNFKKFSMFLANSSLKVIQGYCNKFLRDVKSDIQIKWEGIKMLGNGTLKEEITAYIIRNSEEKSFWTFSGGERARLDYSMILTLQRMINQTHKYGGLDLLMLDEVLEGLDSLGLSDLMKSFENINKTVLITTHVVNRSLCNNILLIRKINGISQIIKN